MLQHICISIYMNIKEFKKSIYLTYSVSGTDVIMEGMRPLWSIKRLISGSSWTGVSYTRVSTIDPLLEPKDTLKEKKIIYLHFFFQKNEIFRSLFNIYIYVFKIIIKKDFLDELKSNFSLCENKKAKYDDNVPFDFPFFQRTPNENYATDQKTFFTNWHLFYQFTFGLRQQT